MVITMNTQELKLQIASKAQIPAPQTMMWTRQLDSNDAPTSWLTYWDNDNRVRVVMHDDVAAKIKSNPAFDQLALKPMEEVTPEGKKPYKLFIVIVPQNVDLSF
jgi:hypothetical protein